MKRCFLIGLSVLLPLVLTFFIVSLMVNIITKPFLSTFVTAFEHYDIFNKPFLFLNGETVLYFMSKLLILLGLAAVVFLFGVIGKLFLFRWLGIVVDYIIHRIPLVNRVYKTTQDIVHTLFVKEETDENLYSRVVLVPFPHGKGYSFGLITNGKKRNATEEKPGHLSVFLPGTPNPAMGFMLFFPKEQVIPVDITVQEAIKFIISCGVVYPASKTQTP